MSNVTPPDSNQGGIPYKPQYEVSPEFRKFWEKLFHGAQLTDTQVHQLTDQFVQTVADNMNQVLNWALQQQKQREEDEKEQGQ